MERSGACLHFLTECPATLGHSASRRRGGTNRASEQESQAMESTNHGELLYEYSARLTGFTEYGASMQAIMAGEAPMPPARRSGALPDGAAAALAEHTGRVYERRALKKCGAWANPASSRQRRPFP
jgi:hypothetical protein